MCNKNPRPRSMQWGDPLGFGMDKCHLTTVQVCFPMSPKRINKLQIGTSTEQPGSRRGFLDRTLPLPWVSCAIKSILGNEVSVTATTNIPCTKLTDTNLSKIELTNTCSRGRWIGGARCMVAGERLGHVGLGSFLQASADSTRFGMGSSIACRKRYKVSSSH